MLLQLRLGRDCRGDAPQLHQTSIHQTDGYAKDTRSETAPM